MADERKLNKQLSLNKDSYSSYYYYNRASKKVWNHAPGYSLGDEQLPRLPTHLPVWHAKYHVLSVPVHFTVALSPERRNVALAGIEGSSQPKATTTNGIR